MLRTAAFVALALLGFAANSLLCRAALAATAIDPFAFTAIRLISGALVLAAIVAARGGPAWRAGDWRGAAALFVYAIAFAWAYLDLQAGVGALLLFGAVQLTMLLAAFRRGERFGARQWCGLAVAVAGLLAMKLPLAGAPLPWAGTLAMLLAGVAWGVYSLLGRGARAPLALTAGNFLRATPFALALLPFAAPVAQWPRAGVLLAIASGALASGIGYALWYAALPALRASQAAMLQLLVPVIAAAGGIVLLGETLDLGLALGGGAILCGVFLALRTAPPAATGTRGGAD